LLERLMNLAELTTRMHAIRDHNDWRPFHSSKNLAMAASVEMAELVEILQWLTEAQSHQLPPEKLTHAGQDMEQVVRAKLADNERRFLGSTAHE
jgi:NTP pyrophosphatase (non-canonical NTP hydrolase)